MSAEPSGRGVQITQRVVKSAHAGSKRQSTLDLGNFISAPNRDP